MRSPAKPFDAWPFLVIVATLVRFPVALLAQPPPGEAPLGAKITAVISKSPAHEAGLHRGDVILQVDGNPIHNGRVLRRVLVDAASDNRSVTVEYLSGRTNKNETCTVQPSTIRGTFGRIGIDISILKKGHPGSGAAPEEGPEEHGF